MSAFDPKRTYRPFNTRLNPYDARPKPRGAAMRRRRFLTLLGSAVTWPLVSHAQQEHPHIRSIGPLKTYDQYRKEMLEKYYFDRLTGFTNTFDPKKKTVILLPGGMGSDLKRTDQPFPAPNNIFDYNLWVSMDTLSGANAPYLQIDQNLADGQQFVLCAEGPISFLGLSPYDQFISQGKRNWNLFVLGFDFRRSIEECANFFMKFITDFKAAICKECDSDPLPDEIGRA